MVTRRRSSLAVAVTSLVLSTAWLAAQIDPLDPTMSVGGVDGQGTVGPQVDIAEGWRDFTDFALIADTSICLLVAMLLGAAIAYHPVPRRKASKIAELEQPKTFIMYSMVGAILGQIVAVDYRMGFVIFGMGGLLRFRTDIGEAKDTGRVILVTVVGICCGVNLYLVAFLGTLFGWLLVWYLERQNAGRMIVRGLDVADLPRADEAYREILEDVGCNVIGGKKNVNKGQVSFIFRAPQELDRVAIQDLFDELPEELQGTIDWDMA